MPYSAIERWRSHASGRAGRSSWPSSSSDDTGLLAQRRILSLAARHAGECLVHDPSVRFNGPLVFGIAAAIPVPWSCSRALCSTFAVCTWSLPARCVTRIPAEMPAMALAAISASRRSLRLERERCNFELNKLD